MIWWKLGKIHWLGIPRTSWAHGNVGSMEHALTASEMNSWIWTYWGRLRTTFAFQKSYGGDTAWYSPSVLPTGKEARKIREVVSLCSQLVGWWFATVTPIHWDDLLEMTIFWEWNDQSLDHGGLIYEHSVTQINCPAWAPSLAPDQQNWVDLSVVDDSHAALYEEIIVNN